MTFTHRDSGTPEEEWQRAFAARQSTLRSLDAEFFAEVGHLVVVAAHPDDETLGAAGLLSRGYTAGVRATVIVATSGEASHPDSATHSPDELARIREAETVDAVARADPGATVRFLRLPDGRLAEHVAEISEAVTEAIGPPARARRDLHSDDLPAPIEPRSSTLLVAPWGGDRHPDHEAAAHAARDAASITGARFFSYPIWLWHWADPAAADVPWPAFAVLPLDLVSAAAKADALSAHTSQIAPLSGLPGDEALLHPGMLEHFARAFEVFVDESAASTGASDEGAEGAESAGTAGGADAGGIPADLTGDAAADYFDGLHDRTDDPWGFESRWYEERKRALLLASLPDPAYASVLEVGSSTGVLSRELAERTSARFLGVDVSAVAIERARQRNADRPVAVFERMRVPSEWPDGSFDLVVVSEIGYFLDEDELTVLIERILGSLTRDGALVVCHWRHPVAGRAFSGDTVHAVFVQRDEFTTLAHHVEEDFLLDVFVRPPAISVARREGIV
ncbi:PIG-L family deacetylase [Herbiconiux daphne]|uniref:Bifunctional PIG-L family deacetylase/class I SAM-dependent methyltransferase n=1 Tax=Herbiconiux daphne TaxID=2970914 RepID=A0ABT2GWD0_9MICO|nr:bifunctional PIG-L family deacetylase/class I SAM-dependent methyltransferase [Herbiconiux daphne]MCS5732258.1 bifunctional PIG-L family deacetylase/class I SAM-dependent methyltransferase [Herbiconiux daphne]